MQSDSIINIFYLVRPETKPEETANLDDGKALGRGDLGARWGVAPLCRLGAARGSIVWVYIYPPYESMLIPTYPPPDACTRRYKAGKFGAGLT